MIGQSSGGHVDGGLFAQGCGEVVFEIRHTAAQRVVIRGQSGFRLYLRQPAQEQIGRLRFPIAPEYHGVLAFQRITGCAPAAQGLDFALHAYRGHCLTSWTLI